MAAALPELTEVDERLNDLDRDCLSCTVCQELFQKAKVLPCNHSFCEQCLTKLVEKESKLDCPICNTSCQLPSGGVPRLKADFFINSLVELYSTKHSLDGEAHQVLCNGCEENEAATWCVDCSLYFCKSCIKPHNVIKRDHSVKTLQERRESKPSMLLQQKVYCSLHPENVVKYFCEICKVVVCTDCAITNHRSAEHILKDLKEAACEYKSQLEDLLSKVNARKQSPEKLTTTANQARETLMSKCKVEEEKVKEKTAKVIEEIRREEKQLIEELREEYEGRAKEVEGQIDKVKLKHRDISSQCGYIEILMHLGTPAQLLNTTEETTNHLKRLISMDAEPHVEVEIIEFQPAEETNGRILGLLMSKKLSFKVQVIRRMTRLLQMAKLQTVRCQVVPLH
ncbi:E3 ubiquitin-protein ligase TRIM56-like [Ptychodera flava]|uniref:E3 ubiquitin-protein ligase TRIM56-like n=1 Tax=Ptychodera flava TaxID=63121 RepID=UPI00396A6DF7